MLACQHTNTVMTIVPFPPVNVLSLQPSCHSCRVTAMPAFVQGQRYVFRDDAEQRSKRSRQCKEAVLTSGTLSIPFRREAVAAWGERRPLRTIRRLQTFYRRACIHLSSADATFSLMM